MIRMTALNQRIRCDPGRCCLKSRRYSKGMAGSRTGHVHVARLLPDPVAHAISVVHTGIHGAESDSLISHLRVGYSATVMITRTGKFLLALAVFALVLSPVRSAFALTAPLHDVDSASHCSGMQQAMHPNVHTMGAGDRAVDGKGHCCGYRCVGACCQGACAHPPVALTGAVPHIPAAGSDNLQVPAIQRLDRRAVSPLFRPPISLPS